ncbi:MAG TPA: ankyrin repeat domain-containing protein [Woeseiaceae bacterium]|nr:ankyrin repeat domain-containing protein [Woeseiaceae bacterium]
MSWRIIALLHIVVLLMPATVLAQSRQEKVDEIIRILVTVDYPMFRIQGLPALTRSKATSQLSRLGKQAELGPEWKAGNIYWDRAAALLRSDFLGNLDRKTAKDRQAEANFKERLEELSDTQLDEVLEFHRSELFRKAMRAGDAMLVMFTRLLLVIEDDTGTQTPPDPKDLERELESFKLSPSEEEQLEGFRQSAAYRQLNRGAVGEFLSTIADPSSLMQFQASETTVSAIGQIVAQFREVHRVPPPLPREYEADFITNPNKEKSFRKLANAAMRGDTEAFSRIQKAAESGEPIAQVELGRLHQIGRGLPQDHKAAFDWTQRAAAQGLPRAQFNLGVHYEHGLGVEASPPDAVENYRRAADQGFARAQLALGLMHRTGKGMPQDFQRSLQFIEAAAKQYLPAAELAMAEIYDVGAGIGRDERVADMWLDRARGQGYAPASQYRAQREKKKAEMLALIKASPDSAKASPTAVDKAELNQRLLAAVKNINVGYVRELLDAGADIETRDTRPHTDETPLHHAARTGNVKVASALVTKGAGVNVTARTGFTPLHVAAGLNRRAMAEYLLSVGANPNALDSSAGTPLHAATLQGHAAMVVLLLEKGADPNSRRERDAYTPLHMFSDIGQYYEPTHTQIIATLVCHGADINAKSKHGTTPLDRARDDAFSALIVHGALLSKPEGPYALLERAARSGQAKPLEYLEQRGHSLLTKGPDGVTLLHVAASNSRASALHYLVGKGLDVNATDISGKTPLYFSVAGCRKENLVFLIGKGARANHVSKQGRTALHAIIGMDYLLYREHCEETVLALLDAGADPRIHDEEGQTPLHVAARQKRLLEKLLSLRADPRAKDKKGRTPLHVYSSYGKTPEPVDVLVKAGADPNAQDVLGRTPLHMYAEWGVGEEGLAIAKALVRNGARTNVRDISGDTPLDAFTKAPYGQSPREYGANAQFIRLLKGEIPSSP